MAILISNLRLSCSWISSCTYICRKICHKQTRWNWICKCLRIGLIKPYACWPLTSCSIMQNCRCYLRLGLRCLVVVHLAQLHWSLHLEFFCSGVKGLLLPPKEHSCKVTICLIWLLNFQGLPWRGCRHDPHRILACDMEINKVYGNMICE